MDNQGIEDQDQKVKLKVDGPMQIMKIDRLVDISGDRKYIRPMSLEYLHFQKTY